MFFGEDNGVQRYDELKYSIFNKLFQQQLGYFGDQKKFLYRKIYQIIKI